MQRSSRLLAAALSRASTSTCKASPSPLTVGSTVTSSLRKDVDFSTAVNRRTATTVAAKTAEAKTPVVKTVAVKTAATTPSKPSLPKYTSATNTSRAAKKTIKEPTPSADPAPKPSDPPFDPTFPLPQPAAALPDYAALAPPLNSTSPSAMPPHSINLVEAPGFADAAEAVHADSDWSTSFYGLSSKPFDKEVAQILMRPLNIKDIEIKPDGLLYLPEIKYRRTLNEAFGPGGWGMAPRGETTIGQRIISREWGLVCLGRLVSVARGEQEYFSIDGIPTAIEASKSNAVLRCCKDLGIASELWDPTFIKDFKKKYCTEVMVEHMTQKKKRKLWRKKEDKFDYPYKEL